MEFGVNHEALVWAPKTISDEDLKRFSDWVDLMMANTDGLSAIEVNLDEMPECIEPTSPLWQAVVAEGVKFRLKVLRIFKVRDGFIKLTFVEPQGGAS